MNEWWKDPKFLMIGGVAIFAGFILLRNQNASTANTTNPNQFPTTNPANNTTPVGQSYSYLDGTGMQHLVATDPNGQLTSYQSVSPQDPSQTGQLGSYVGMMGNPMFVNPYGGWSPYYSQLPVSNN
jgi:hypothetical protein